MRLLKNWRNVLFFTALLIWACGNLSEELNEFGLYATHPFGILLTILYITSFLLSITVHFVIKAIEK